MTTYEEYRLLRRQIGYDDDLAMIESVWNGCEADAQEDMLNQLRPHAQAAVEREQRYGQVW